MVGYQVGRMNGGTRNGEGVGWRGPADRRLAVGGASGSGRPGPPRTHCGCAIGWASPFRMCRDAVSTYARRSADAFETGRAGPLKLYFRTVVPHGGFPSAGPFSTLGERGPHSGRAPSAAPRPHPRFQRLSSPVLSCPLHSGPGRRRTRRRRRRRNAEVPCGPRAPQIAASCLARRCSGRYVPLGGTGGGGGIRRPAQARSRSLPRLPRSPHPARPGR